MYEHWEGTILQITGINQRLLLLGTYINHEDHVSISSMNLQRLYLHWEIAVISLLQWISTLIYPKTKIEYTLICLIP